MSISTSIGNYLNKVVDRTANFVKDNKVAIATTVVTGGAGAVKGAVTKTGLHFGEEAVKKATKESIINGAKSGANSAVKGAITGTAVQILIDPDSALNKTSAGKAINKAIDGGASAVKGAINWLFGSGSK